MQATLPEEMENSSDEPSTSAAASSGRQPSSSPPDGPIKIDPMGSFYFLFEVGKKLASGSHGTAFEGIRRTDGNPVIIKFVKKFRFDFHIGQSKPLCREAAIMRIMKHSDHVMKLYDWFEVVHYNILTMEHPGTNMTLSDFVKENGGCLSEAEAKDIMQKLIAALQHCSEQGVYYKNISLRKVLIDKDTMQIKLTGFYRALTITEIQKADFKSEAERTYHALMVANKGLYRVLKGMVERKYLWCGSKNTHLSKECQDLLGKLCDGESDITLQNIVDHDWFNNTPDTDALESDAPGQEPTPAADATETEPHTPGQEPTPAADATETEPHTPGQEPTPAADATETEPHTPGQEPTPAAGAPETEPHTPGQEPTPAAGAPETEPHTPGQEPTPAADAPETEPHTPGQEPTPAAGAPETEPHTPGQEPTPAAGAPETEPHTPGQEPTPAAGAPETEPHTPGQEPTPAADAPETEPHTPGQEPTPAADAPETEPDTPGREPTPAAGAPETEPHTPGQEPTPAAGAPETEPHTPGQEPSPAAGAPETEPDTLRREPTPAAGAPETEPHTPRREPTRRGTDSVETTDLTLMFPGNLLRQKEYYRSLYVVGGKLQNNDLVRTGIRRSDNKKVVIRFVPRSRCREEFEKPDRNGESMMELQKAPTCDYIIRFYDRFITEQSYILVTEYISLHVTFDEFMEMSSWRLREWKVKRIIRQIICIMRHSVDRGFFYDVNKKWILIHPTTLYIKLLDFDLVYFTRNEEDHALMKKELFSTKIMQDLMLSLRLPSEVQATVSEDSISDGHANEKKKRSIYLSL